MPTKVGSYDVQASPGVLALCKGWDLIREMADAIAPTWKDEWWVEERFIMRGREKSPEAPDLVYVMMWEYEGMVIEIIGYIDPQGIKVFSFDPARKLQSLGEGHQRLK